MHHEYYYYNKEQLLANPKIPMVVMEDKPAVFQTIAREMADFIKEKNAPPPKARVPCPPSFTGTCKPHPGLGEPTAVLER